MVTLQYSTRNYKKSHKSFKNNVEAFRYLYGRGYSLVCDGDMSATRLQKYSYRMKRHIFCNLVIV